MNTAGNLAMPFRRSSCSQTYGLYLVIIMIFIGFGCGVEDNRGASSFARDPEPTVSRSVAALSAESASIRVLAPTKDAGMGAMVEYEYEVGGLDYMYEVEDIELALPDGLYTASVVRVVAQPRGFMWHGRIHEAWDVVLTTYDCVLSGNIYTPWETYEILSGSDGVPRIAQIDFDLFPGCAQADTPLSKSPGASPGLVVTNTPPVSSSDPIVVDVLIVYTPQARMGAGGTAQVEATIQSAVNLTNTAYVNSQIDIQLNLVHTQEVPHTDSGSSGRDLRYVEEDPAMIALRNTFGADMMGIMVESNGTCGMAYLQITPGPDFAPRAVHVSARRCAAANLTMAHEFGHNQGANHDPANAPSPGVVAYPYAFGHFHSSHYRTIMSYSDECVGGCPRTTQFSNPSVDHLGLATGIVDERDNHRTLNNTAAIVAAFRNPTRIEFAQESYRVSENTQTVSVELIRTGDTTNPASVVVRTREARALGGRDFMPKSETVRWAAGDATPRTISFTILDDRVQEGQESFQVTMSNSLIVSAGVTSVATVVIDDVEEGVFEVAQPEVTVAENQATVQMAVKRTGGLDGAVSVRYFTESDTATAEEDFVPVSDVLRWEAGDASTRFVTLSLKDDRLAEGFETFRFVLSNPAGNAGLGRAETTVTIEDWEAGQFEFTNAEYRASEGGGAISVEVVRLGGSKGEAQVQLVTEGRTATAQQDFVPLSTVLTFPDGFAGPLVATIELKDDQQLEGAESFDVRLSQPTNDASLGALETAQVVIEDQEEGLVRFATSTVEVAENQPTVSVVVERVDGQDGPASVTYAVISRTAQEGTDFEATSGSLTWADGDGAPKTIEVNLLDDDEPEDDESFRIRLLSATSARLDVADEIEVILHDFEEGEIVAAQPEYRVDEAAGKLTVTFERQNGSDGEAILRYRTASGTALESADFVPQQGELIWASGDTGPKTIELSIVSDDDAELEERFEITLESESPRVQVGPAVSIIIGEDPSGCTCVTPASPPSSMAMWGFLSLGLLAGYRRRKGS